MQLLSKKQAKNAKQVERELLITKGIRVAKMVDALKVKYRQNREHYENELNAIIDKLNKDILKLQGEKSQLEREITNLKKHA